MIPGGVARRVATAADDWVLLCVNPAGGRKLAAWTLSEPHRLELDLNGTRVSLELAAMPKYVLLK